MGFSKMFEKIFRPKFFCTIGHLTIFFMQTHVWEPQTPRTWGFSGSDPLDEEKGKLLWNIFAHTNFFVRPIGHNEKYPGLG